MTAATGKLMKQRTRSGLRARRYVSSRRPQRPLRPRQAAGAEIILDIKDEDYGGRGYTCRDPEGHVWNFGSYDPWKK